MPRIQTSRRSTPKRNGALTVEVAICLPVLFMILFGCYELSKANLLHHAAENAAYEAARVGVVPGATAQKCRDHAGAILRSIGIRTFNVQVQPANINKSTPTVSVLVEVPLRDNTVLSPVFFGATSFRGVCEMQREAF